MAKIQHDACQKLVKRDAFLKAIEVDDAPSAAVGLDLDAMSVDSAYDGVKLGDEMTLEFIEDMIERFKNGKTIHRKYVFQIILAVTKLVYEEPTMVETQVAKGQQITVCGDTHGTSLDSNQLIDRCANYHTNTNIRSILRSAQHFQAQRRPHGRTRISLQRRLC